MTAIHFKDSQILFAPGPHIAFEHACCCVSPYCAHCLDDLDPATVDVISAAWTNLAPCTDCADIGGTYTTTGGPSPGCGLSLTVNHTFCAGSWVLKTVNVGFEATLISVVFNFEFLGFAANVSFVLGGLTAPYNCLTARTIPFSAAPFGSPCNIPASVDIEGFL